MAPKKTVGLTPAERRVVATILNWNTTLEEASIALDISPRTVQTHLQNIFPKLGVKNKCELILIMKDGHRA